ncbi:tyrosine-type recombinase/integrase [Leucobacter salsicius]|uniref:tyrosine-type recombinase/integrase n=1 Tax=Leucobacter salsicius TaxID=664638 RepID=UPI00034D7DAA|nr:tyrosine-type recombinase/integrase [Leucobacter salsicius]
MTKTTLAPITNIDAVLTTLESALAPTTVKAYAQEMKTLDVHFASRGWALYPQEESGQLDAARFTQQVLSYLQERKSGGVTLSTITKTLSAIKHDASRKNAHALGLLNSEIVAQFVSGLTRTHRRNETPQKAEALTAEQITALHRHLKRQGAVRAVRDRALIAIGIAAALRSSSIAELKLKDISSTRTYDGILLTVRFSKTDQEAVGVSIPVKAAPQALVDPVRALNAWLSLLASQGITKETHPDFPVFPTMRGEQIKHTAIKHPAITITKLVRDSLTAAGITTEVGSAAYSSHSLRATFITLSSQQGISAENIARISQHSSLDILRSYDRTSVEAFGQVSYLTV